MASATVLAPVAYLFIIIGGLYAFSHFYRNRAARKVPDPYFPPHKERNVYMTLARMTDPPAPDSLLKAALVRRAVQDVQRIVRLREDKPALSVLLQKGSIGDDLWSSFQAAEKEVEVEIAEVVGEANFYVEGWGQFIFQSASEIYANEKTRAAFEKTNEARTDLEQKYARKAKFQPVPIVFRANTPAPNAPGTPNAKTAQLPPASPQLTPAKALNGIAPGLRPPTPSIPPSASGYVSSDAESATSTARSSGKKGKKRK